MSAGVLAHSRLVTVFGGVFFCLGGGGGGGGHQHGVVGSGWTFVVFFLRRWPSDYSNGVAAHSGFTLVHPKPYLVHGNTAHGRSPKPRVPNDLQPSYVGSPPRSSDERHRQHSRPDQRTDPELCPRLAERAALQAAIKELAGVVTEIPVVVNGHEHHTDKTVAVTSPQRHQHRLATAHQAPPTLLQDAIDGAAAAQQDWEHWSFADRAAVFLKAADLLSGPWRARMNAATMLGQGKTPHQAEIDAACELADFLRFNVHYAERLLHEQPISVPGVWNRLDYRPLEGFVYAITPFNFTAIGGNLPTAPAILGNVVLWKPSTTALLSNWLFYQILREAGLPPGVIQFVPGESAAVTDVLLSDPRLAGIHFTGSTPVFHQLWKGVSERLDQYRAYPRLVGETGGKNFILAHPSADVEALVTALVRGAFEYQGQKCSAASRCYIPRSLWPTGRGPAA